MGKKILAGSVEQILIETAASSGEQYGDDYGNIWQVHEDRDGLRLQIKDNPDAWIPYWTANTIKLPGLHRI
ncbi:MAG: hypothetical protein V3T17_05370 [Pseudomonadales bacterium]